MIFRSEVCWRAKQIANLFPICFPLESVDNVDIILFYMNLHFRTSRSVFNRGLSMDDMVTKGEEPTQCHEIDDDEDCDEVSSEKSNESH